jgi:hypothetical protein
VVPALLATPVLASSVVVVLAGLEPVQPCGGCRVADPGIEPEPAVIVLSENRRPGSVEQVEVRVVDRAGAVRRAALLDTVGEPLDQPRAEQVPVAEVVDFAGSQTGDGACGAGEADTLDGIPVLVLEDPQPVGSDAAVEPEHFEVVGAADRGSEYDSGIEANPAVIVIVDEVAAQSDRHDAVRQRAGARRRPFELDVVPYPGGQADRERVGVGHEINGAVELRH